MVPVIVRVCGLPVETSFHNQFSCPNVELLSANATIVNQLDMDLRFERLDCTIVCANMPISVAHWLPAVPVEGDDWPSVIQEVPYITFVCQENCTNTSFVTNPEETDPESNLNLIEISVQTLQIDTNALSRSAAFFVFPPSAGEILRNTGNLPPAGTTAITVQRREHARVSNTRRGTREAGRHEGKSHSPSSSRVPAARLIIARPQLGRWSSQTATQALHKYPLRYHFDTYARTYLAVICTVGCSTVKKALSHNYRLAPRKVGNDEGKVVKLREIRVALNNEVLRADGGEMSNAGVQGRGKWEIPEKTSRPAASSGTIPTCKNPKQIRPGFEPGSQRRDTSRRLTAQPPRPRKGTVHHKASVPCPPCGQSVIFIRGTVHHKASVPCPPCGQSVIFIRGTVHHKASVPCPPCGQSVIFIRGTVHHKASVPCPPCGQSVMWNSLQLLDINAVLAKEVESWSNDLAKVGDKVNPSGEPEPLRWGRMRVEMLHNITVISAVGLASQKGIRFLNDGITGRKTSDSELLYCARQIPVFLSSRSSLSLCKYRPVFQFFCFGVIHILYASGHIFHESDVSCLEMSFRCRLIRPSSQSDAMPVLIPSYNQSEKEYAHIKVKVTSTTFRLCAFIYSLTEYLPLVHNPAESVGRADI
ncbi:hypothetical protein PR048_010650 [Dryococelus australis]|uniref:Uncharacterized protein n=1 Tax=Dryococelus australis TaxID=614101 RepID=A0ABQ9I3C0_9NEOP|nr:hypothetical protein PR048_010650 [Dryococelus australis]